MRTRCSPTIRDFSLSAIWPGQMPATHLIGACRSFLAARSLLPLPDRTRRQASDRTLRFRLSDLARAQPSMLVHPLDMSALNYLVSEQENHREEITHCVALGSTSTSERASTRRRLERPLLLWRIPGCLLWRGWFLPFRSGPWRCFNLFLL